MGYRWSIKFPPIYFIKGLQQSVFYDTSIGSDIVELNTALCGGRLNEHL